MFLATGKERYLRRALKRSLEAIDQAEKNRRPLLYRGRKRGVWPCFLHPMTEKTTGGHSQLNDFQGATGLLMVARLLKEHNYKEWKTIGDFVEKNIINKWLVYNPRHRLKKFTTHQSDIYLLRVLDRSRDKHEHFACIALDMHALGYKQYPYEKWARTLIFQRLSERSYLDNVVAKNSKLRTFFDGSWGLTYQDSGALIWHVVLKRFVTVVQDTSHANRTVWLAAKAYEEGIISQDIIDGMIRTLKFNIHDPEKGIFYFRNSIDGGDKAIGRSEPGRRGNLWFGWHRLAAYDAELCNLFIGLAHDLANGGKNILPRQAQNRTFAEAPLCFYAWAARLCKENKG
jgi:hypothetical protein